MPKLDFEFITMAHGSGGMLTRQLLERVILQVLPEVDHEYDAASLSLGSELKFTTDSFVISPIFFPGGNIGELAVNGTVNDLAMSGAIPRFLSLSLIIEEGLPLTELWSVLQSIQVACQEAEVSIKTGDTKVVERGKGDKIYINTAGIGELRTGLELRHDCVQAGDVIIVSDSIATHGMAVMSVREGLEFETDILSDTRPLHEISGHLLDTFGSQIRLLKDPTRGGVATVLAEIVAGRPWGIDLMEQEIPVLRQVAAACELLGLDPLYVANEGIFLVFADASIADETVAALQQHPFGQMARKIGHVTEEHPGRVVLQGRIGGSRVLSLLPGNQLPRIC